jgi:hypothetical protein
VCPACLTSLAITVATTTGAGAAATALVVRVARSFQEPREARTKPRKEAHDNVESNRLP